MKGTDQLMLNFPAARRKLRVAMVTETYPPEINGAAMTVSRIAEGLQGRGHTVQLVRPRQSPSEQPVHTPLFEEVLKPGLPIPRHNSLKIGLPAKQALIRLWAAHRPDIVHVFTEGPLGWSALAAAEKLRLPVVTNFHTNYHRRSEQYGFGWLKNPITAYLRIFHNKAQRTFVPTSTLQDELSDLGLRNLQVVARGVDTRLFNPARRSIALRRSWGGRPKRPRGDVCRPARGGKKSSGRIPCLLDDARRTTLGKTGAGRRRPGTGTPGARISAGHIFGNTRA